MQPKPHLFELARKNRRRGQLKQQNICQNEWEENSSGRKIKQSLERKAQNAFSKGWFIFSANGPDLKRPTRKIDRPRNAWLSFQMKKAFSHKDWQFFMTKERKGLLERQPNRKNIRSGKTWHALFWMWATWKLKNDDLQRNKQVAQLER